MPSREISLVTLDTETTGLSARNCELVEVAAIRFHWGGEVVDRYETLIDPCCPIPYNATAIHGINNEMVRGKPTVRQAIPALFDFLAREPTVVLIHNAGFDLSFLRTAAERLGMHCPDCPVICTLGLARKRLRDMPRHRLDILVEKFLGRGKADHRAGGDADALRVILMHMMAREPIIGSVEELRSVAKVKTLRKGPLRQTSRYTQENAQI